MFGDPAPELPQQISFLIVPGFSMLGFAAMVDPLRWANTLSGDTLYRWRIVSPDGAATASSDQISLLPDCALDDIDKTDLLIVCAGYNPQQARNSRLLGSLRRLASHGADIGAQDTGSYLLAAAGLLDGYRATIHWESQDSYDETFRHVTVVEELFEVDRNRFSCSGGLSGLDMMLYLISEQHGSELAAAVSDQLIYHQVRDGTEHQRMSTQSRYGISNAKLLETIDTMQQCIEQPLAIPALAENIHVSERELERLFRKYLDATPVAFYRRLRLEKARQLLQQTTENITQIAVRCGFGSASHFSRSYHRQFGYPPNEERKQLRQRAAQ